MYPWLGTKQFDTLRRILQKVIGTDKVRPFSPYYIDIRTKLSGDEILERVQSYIGKADGISLIYDDDIIRSGKFDKFIPDSLLMREYAADKLDFDLDL